MSAPSSEKELRADMEKILELAQSGIDAYDRGDRFDSVRRHEDIKMLAEKWADS